MEPPMLPSPPMTTTTKASTITPMPMPRYAVVMGAAATPPSPASAHAAPNTSVRTRATSAPRQSAISLFWATARMTSPARVVCRSSHTAPPTTSPRTTRKSR